MFCYTACIKSVSALTVNRSPKWYNFFSCSSFLILQPLKSFKAYRHFPRIVLRIIQTHLVNCYFYTFCSVAGVGGIAERVNIASICIYLQPWNGKPRENKAKCMFVESASSSRISENDLMLWSCALVPGVGAIRVKTIFTMSYTFWMFDIMLSVQLWNEFWAVLKSQ